MTFRSFDDALRYGKMHGHDWCRACDRWVIEPAGKDLWKIAIKFKLSGTLVGYIQ